MTDYNAPLDVKPPSFGFLRNWAATQAIADRLLVGPRSVQVLDILAPDTWVEPIARIIRRTQCPLAVDSVSVFLAPPFIEPRAGVVLIRTCHWDGEDDKQKCRTAFVAAPSVGVKYCLASRDQVALIDERVREVDAALARPPTPIEGLNVEDKSGDPPTDTERMPLEYVSANELWTIRRVSAFVDQEMRWGSANATAAQLTSGAERLWKCVVDVMPAMRAIQNCDVVETYRIGESPSDIARLLDGQSASASAEAH